MPTRYGITYIDFTYTSSCYLQGSLDLNIKYNNHSILIYITDNDRIKGEGKVLSHKCK